MSTKYHPRPVFDTKTEVLEQYKCYHNSANPRQEIDTWLNHCFSGVTVNLPSFAAQDFQLALNFLHSYRGSDDTFNAYRRDLERLLQWSWFVRQQSVLKHKREDIEAFVEFCLHPDKSWIGLSHVARFKKSGTIKQPNPAWRPFVATVSKKDRQSGAAPNPVDYQLSQQSLKVMFGILGSFYNYLVQEELSQVNPVMLIRQKSKFIRKEAVAPVVRRLTDKQWQQVIHYAKEQAKVDCRFERTVFILSCLYSMYLRISELTANERWAPSMGDFFKDSSGNWWFKTVGKGNKSRQVAVSEAMLAALKHYREHLNLSPYPMPDEKIPLISHQSNLHAPITSTRPIRRIVQDCFDAAADKIAEAGDQHEADLLRAATVHWLRHTGISEDVKIRPREHVRDDAGHSSSAITDRYIDVELKERARSAQKKKLSE